jgi:hypothetical protein
MHFSEFLINVLSVIVSESTILVELFLGLRYQASHFFLNRYVPVLLLANIGNIIRTSEQLVNFSNYN